MKTSQQMKKSVMRRVHVISAARSATSPMALKALALVGVLAESRQYFSIKHVLANSPSFTHVADTLGFFSTAFTHAERVAQIIVALGVLLLVWLARDVGRRVSLASRELARAQFS